MKFAKILAGLLAAVMFMLSAVSGVSGVGFGDDFVITDGDIDPETGLMFTPLEDNTYPFTPESDNPDNVVTGGFRKQHDPAKEFVYGDFKFAPTDDNGLFLSGIANFDIVDAKIPDTVNGKKVTHIDGAAFQDFDYNTMNFIFCDRLKSVTIPSGVISIGEGAFNGCSNLENVTIPNTVEEIKFGAFWECASLKSITIPKSVTILEIPSGGLFSGCVSLTDVYFEGTKEQFETIMLNGANKLGNDTIWDGTVYDWKTDTTRQVTIHYNANSPTDKVENGVKYTLLEDDTYSVGGTNSEIYPSALVIPSEIDGKKVSTIEEGAFKNWKGLNAAVIPNTISQIPKSAFENCATIKSLTLPSSITLIDENAFKDTYLEYVRFDGSKEQWDNIEIKDGNSTLKDALENGRIVFNSSAEPQAPTLDTTIEMPETIEGGGRDNLVLSWENNPNVAKYKFSIHINGKYLSEDIETPHNSLNETVEFDLDGIPLETYCVELTAFDENGNYNKKDYIVKFGALPDDNAQIPKISINSDKIGIEYEGQDAGKMSFWVRIKDKADSVVGLEKCYGQSYSGLDDFPNGDYTIDVCTLVYYADINSIRSSNWSTPLEVSKTNAGIGKPDTNNPTTNEPTTSEPTTSEPGDDTSEPNTPNTSDPASDDTDTSNNTSDTDESDTSSPDTSDTSDPTSDNNSDDDTSNPETSDSEDTSGTTSGDTSNPENPAPDKPSTPPVSDSGEFGKDIVSEDNGVSVEIVTALGSLMDAVLTDAEREMLKNGVDINVVLNISADSNSISKVDKEAAEAALNDLGYTAGIYLDVRLFKTVGDKQTQLDTTNNPIALSMEIPESLRKAGRKYAVVRVHNGKTDILDNYSDKENTVIIRTDKFSTYVLAYSDGKGGAVGTQPGNNTDNTPGFTGGNTGNPPTGKKTHTKFFFAAGIVSLFIFTILCFFTGKNGMTEEEKDRKFGKIIAWGKRGSKLRAALALVAIFLLLTFYYGIGMKPAKN